MILSTEAREMLDAMASRYHAELTVEALDYLYGRGISQAAIDYFRLGVVDGSYLEHADYTGRIAIPYVTKLGGVVGFKFRVPHECGEGHEHAKYITPYPTRIYNPLAFEQAEQLGYIGIAEGEIDAMIATAECDIPTVGAPGADTWVKHPEWPGMFDGYARVFVFKDQDDAGEKLARRIDHDIEQAVIINLPAKDVNETFIAYGSELIRNAAGLD